MSYAFNAYWFVALVGAAITFFIIFQYLIGFISEIYKLHTGGKRAIERMRNLKRAEPPAPEAAVSPHVPLPVGGEVEPILEQAERPAPEAALSPDLPLPVGAEVEPILEHVATPTPEAAVIPDVPPAPEADVAPDLPLPVDAAVEPILEHAATPAPEAAVIPDEPPAPEAAVTPDLPLLADAAVEPILEHAAPPAPEAADVPPPVGGEVEPILEYAEPPAPAASVNLDLPLPVDTEVEPILEHAEPLAPAASVSLNLPLPVRAEVEPILEHAAPPAPKAAVSPDVPLPVKAEIEPILEYEPLILEASVSPDGALPVGAKVVEPMVDHVEPPASEAVVSPDLPPSASAKVEPILGHAEPPAPEAPVSPDLPPPDSAKVEPVLEHAEPPEVTGNVYTAQKDYDGATAKYNGTIKLDPKFPVAYENHNLTKGKTGEGSIGVTIRRVTDGAAHALNVKPACGALVIDIDENGPAKAAGIESRDVIVKVDGRDVKEWRDLPRIVADTSIGKEIAVTIVRNGKELTKTVKIGRLEYADEQASFSSQNGSAPQTKSVVVDAKSAAKHLAPAMAIVENKHQPLLLVPTAPPRFGKRPIDRFSRVSH